MQVKLLDEIFEYPNTLEAISQCLELIERRLSENATYVLSHVRIDGEEIYDDYQEHMHQRIQDIGVVEVKIVPFKKLLDETIINLRNYLQRALPVAAQVADSFYMSAGNASWSGLADLLDGLQWIMQVIPSICTTNNGANSYANAAHYEEILYHFIKQITELETSFQSNDTILMGDLLRYEIVELMKKLLDEVQFTIDNEVVPDGLN